MAALLWLRRCCALDLTCTSMSKRVRSARSVPASTLVLTRRAFCIGWGVAEALGRTCVKPVTFDQRRGMMPNFAPLPAGGSGQTAFGAPFYTFHRGDLHRALADAIPSRPLSPNGCSPTLAPKMALFTSASVAVDVLPSRFHTILIVSGQMQFVFFVGVVVRRKCIGHRHT